jgi:hypothetical protein
MVKLDGKLTAGLRGESKPASPMEALQLATLCRFPARRLHAASARLAAEAFAGDPKLADDLKAQHRYNAACSAALAAAGQAEDAADLSTADRVELRRQALAWLRADLAAYTTLLDKSPAPVREVLQHWQKDTDLSCLRDKVSLAELLQDELQAWRQLWADVAALLKRAQAMSEKGSDRLTRVSPRGPLWIAAKRATAPRWAGPRFFQRHHVDQFVAASQERLQGTTHCVRPQMAAGEPTHGVDHGIPL